MLHYILRALSYTTGLFSDYDITQKEMIHGGRVAIVILNEQVKQYQALDDWFNTPQGVRLSYAFAAELKRLVGSLRGARLLQLGACGDNPWLSALNFRQKWLASPVEGAQTVSVISALDCLPIERSSMDCVIAPLTMEVFGGQNKNPIDEIDRILKPMGYVIVLGINPWSFWGAAVRLGCVSCFAERSSTLTSSLAVKHAFLNRGYTQYAFSSFYYIPPVSHPLWIRYCEFFNEMGKMIWPFPAGFYCFIAQKYQLVTPSLWYDRWDRSLIYSARN
jgi:hypothetical protein